MDQALRDFDLVTINRLQQKAVSVPIAPIAPRAISEILTNKLVYLSFDYKRDRLITTDCLAMVIAKVDRNYILDLITQMVTNDYDNTFVAKLVSVGFLLASSEIKPISRVARPQYCLDLALTFSKVKGSFKLLEKASRCSAFVNQITDSRLTRLIPKLRFVKLHKRAILCLRDLLSHGFGGYPIDYLNTQSTKLGFNYYISAILIELDFIQTMKREDVVAVFTIIDQNPMIDICSSADVIFKIRRRFGINSRGFEFTNIALKTLYESLSVVIDAIR